MAHTHVTCINTFFPFPLALRWLTLGEPLDEAGDEVGVVLVGGVCGIVLFERSDVALLFSLFDEGGVAVGVTFFEALRGVFEEGVALTGS